MEMRGLLDVRVVLAIAFVLVAKPSSFDLLQTQAMAVMHMQI